MKFEAAIIFAYGIVTLFFGVYWFFADDNFLALIFGIAIFAVMSGNALSAYRNNYAGIYITIVLALVLTIVFALRFTKSVTILPGGIMFLSSIITLGFSVFSLSRKKNYNRDGEK